MPSSQRWRSSLLVLLDLQRTCTVHVEALLDIGARMVRFLRASPYEPDRLLSLPIRPGELAAATEYYVRVFGFAVTSRGEDPPSLQLQRDDVTIGLAENGGDPTQEGAFIAVDDIDGTFAELAANGLVRTLVWMRACQLSITGG